MAEKILPIKFFQKREKDWQDTEGGGSGKLPKWVLQGQELATRSKQLRTYLRSVSRRMVSSESKALPIIFKAKLDDDATAKSHREAITSLFNLGGKVNVIGVLGLNELLIKVDNVDDISQIEANISRAMGTEVSVAIAKGVSAIEELTDISPIVSLEVPEETIFKIKLIDYQHTEINQKAKELFEEICRQYKITIAPAGYLHDETIYRAEATMDSLNELLEFEGLFSIEDMPSFSLSMDEVEEGEPLALKQPVEGRDYPVVGVLDSGIERIAGLKEWMLEERETNYPDEYTNKRHGTGVTSILLHGDELQGKEYTGAQGCRVFEACVFPDTDKTSIYEDVLIQQIENCIRKHAKDIKIWNLCLGTTLESSALDFSDFGKSLDTLQKELGIMIIKSVGNCENFKRMKPRGRISKSADSIMSLVVGSLTHEKGEYDLYDAYQPSPFTRVGPGPCFIHKPDLVHIGGNAGLQAGRVVYNGVKCLGIDGQVRKASGTSFGTPRVSAGVASLHEALDMPFDPLLLKALMIHHAQYPKDMTAMDMSERLSLAGFGMPSHLKDMLYNDPDEITLILMDRLEKGNFINILDFPFPPSMVDENGYYYGEVTVTLVTDPILEPKQQGGEYCQSNIEVIFGSYDNKKQRDTSKPTIKNEIGPEGGRNLLNADYYSKTLLKDVSNPFKTERLLVAYERKYHPIKKWVVNLSEMTAANKDKCLLAPKLWYLNLRGFIRDHTEKKYERLMKTPNQKFCLMVTIRDPKKRGVIYNEVTQQLRNFSFVQTDIKLSERVRVNL